MAVMVKGNDGCVTAMPAGAVSKSQRNPLIDGHRNRDVGSPMKAIAATLLRVNKIIRPLVPGRRFVRYCCVGNREVRGSRSMFRLPNDRDGLDAGASEGLWVYAAFLARVGLTGPCAVKTKNHSERIEMTLCARRRRKSYQRKYR
jgi:hypothetical protein